MKELVKSKGCFRLRQLLLCEVSRPAEFPTVFEVSQVDLKGRFFPRWICAVLLASTQSLAHASSARLGFTSRIVQSSVRLRAGLPREHLLRPY